MPKRLGLWIEDSPKLFAWLDRRINKGRRVQTGTFFWFMMLYTLAALRRIRRGTLRHLRETEHREGDDSNGQQNADRLEGSADDESKHSGFQTLVSWRLLPSRHF